MKYFQKAIFILLILVLLFLNIQRGVASSFYGLANYASKYGPPAAGISFVSNALGDVSNNVANIWDPRVDSGSRMFAVGLSALDVGSGGKGSGAGNSAKRGIADIVKIGSEIGGAKMTKHAVGRFYTRGINVGQIENALKNGVKYLDTKNNTYVWAIGNQSKGGYTVVTNLAKDKIVTVENFVQNLSAQGGKRFIKQ